MNAALTFPASQWALDESRSPRHDPAPMDALSIFSPLTPAEERRLALVAPGVAWTFADLVDLARALSARLSDRGVQPGSRVAFRAAPSPEVFLAIVTLASMGATLVPIHPRLSPAEVRVLIDVTRPDIVLDEADRLIPTSAELRAWRALVTPDRTSSLGRAPSFDRASSDRISSERASDHASSDHASSDRASSREAAPFAIVTTSGTTGRPKGAVLSRRAVIASAEASAKNLGWEPDDRWLLAMPLAHVGGLSIITRCLHARRTVVMLPRFDPRLVLDAIRDLNVTLLSVVPTMLRALFEADADDALSRPRAILLGGAAAPAAELEECARRSVRVLTTYGLTEACSQVTSQSPALPAIYATSALSATSALPAIPTIRGGSGAPLAGIEVRIASTSAAETAPLPAGNTGRILVRGPVLFDGYLLPDGSIDPARTEGGWFETGDLGELDETGSLHVHVRRTDLIVTGGENVYPVEVEQAIERLPGVRRAAVFGVPDARWGQLVAAAIEAAPGTSTSALTDLLTKTLAPFKRPRKWTIVPELPVTPSGKLQRNRLAEELATALRPPE